MKRYTSLWKGAVLASLLLAGCVVEDPDPNDATPPSVLFTVQVAQLGRPQQSFEVPAEGLTRTLPADATINFQGLGSDSESGIESTMITGEYRKTCSIGGDLAQSRNANILVREPRTVPSPPLSAVGAGLDVGIDYVSCPGSLVGAGGSMRVVATNSVGGQTTSGTFTWNFVS